MALQITFTDPQTEVVYSNSYHRVFGVLIDKDSSFAQIHIKIYKDEATRDAGISSTFFWRGSQFAKISCTNDDFITYFDTDPLIAVSINPQDYMIQKAYEFLRTQDPDEADYQGDCPFDYKNDASDV